MCTVGEFVWNSSSVYCTSFTPPLCTVLEVYCSCIIYALLSPCCIGGDHEGLYKQTAQDSGSISPGHQQSPTVNEGFTVLCCVYIYIYCISLSCREFGAKVMNVKILMKAIPALFEHSDKNVRAEVSK